MNLQTRSDENLHALEQRIRKFVNNARIQSGLLKRPADWNTLCSAMDVVGDTEVALDSYLAQREAFEESFLYIIAYGVLQALQTQQDAVFAICRIFDLKKPDNEALRRIRQIRARSIGHPTLEKEDGQALAGLITRVSLTHSGFQLLIAFEKDNKHEVVPVDLPELIRIQRVELCKALKPVLDLLVEDEKVHREQHRSTKLAEIFHPTTSYSVEKVFEGILSRDRELGQAHVSILQTELDEFRADLQKRGPQVEDFVRYDVARVEHAPKRLLDFFAGRGHLDPDDAYIFAAFADTQVQRLVATAAEIDSEYEKPVRNE